VDEWIAHNVPAIPAGRSGHAKVAPLEYVLRRKVDLICYTGGQETDELMRPPRSEAAWWAARGYAWVCMEPEGFAPATGAVSSALTVTWGLLSFQPRRDDPPVESCVE
jgi:hypothetical protein